MKRRSFFKELGRSTAGTALGVTFLRSGVLAVPPSDRIVVGHIGVGGMGNSHVGWFSSFRDVEIAALCDVDEKHLKSTRSRVKKKRPRSEIKLYGDFRKLLERDDIEAVTIATPDHWHALAAVHAFRAGKDVYSEKPLSYSIPEARAMVNAQKKYKRIFQLGTQIHAGENYHRVVELVRSGRLGKIHTVRVWKTGGAPMIKQVPDRDPPEHLDWDMWLGPRPERRYNPHRCHFNFRYFWDYSGGVYADFWCHISDIVFWSLQLGSPLTVKSRGVLNTRGMAETHKWIEVDFEFEDLKYYWTSHIPEIRGAGGRGIGACFEGTEGHLVTDYNSRKIFINGKEVPGGDFPGVKKSIRRSPGHQRNFVESVRSRRPTESNLPYAHNMTIPMHLGLIAYWTGRKLKWDGKAEKFKGDKEANSLLTKEFREPWTMPEV